MELQGDENADQGLEIRGDESLSAAATKMEEKQSPSQQGQVNGRQQVYPQRGNNRRYGRRGSSNSRERGRFRYSGSNKCLEAII